MSEWLRKELVLRGGSQITDMIIKRKIDIGNELRIHGYVIRINERRLVNNVMEAT